MHNVFQAEQFEHNLLQLQKKQRMARRWQHRHKTQVIPALVTRFNRRMDGFVKKMEDEPVTLPQEPPKRGDAILLREFDETLNVGQGKFRFRDSVDWNSLYPPIERAERNELLKEYSQNNMDTMMAFRSIFSQSKYNPSQPEYRLRHRAKEINPAMRYATKNTSATLQVLPNIRKKAKPAKSLDNKKYSSPESLSELQDEEATTSNEGRNSTIDVLINSSVLRRGLPRVHEKTQQQLREEEQLKMLAHNRLYFKSMQSMELQMPVNGQKTALKELLEKCGVKKSGKGKHQTEELDNFAQLMGGDK